MIAVRGGSFVMGSSAFYPEEAPPHVVDVEPFELDETPVTNDDFAAFVEDTAYATVAEQALDAVHYPHLAADELGPGSIVFVPTRGPVDLHDVRQWWTWVPGASWRHPRGPASGLFAVGDHPVVQVAFADALAYAVWAGKRLPTEIEFEYAAQGGRPPSRYAWGEERTPGGRHMANTWQGRFPYLNTAEDGWEWTSPVGAFPRNPFGLADMIGNVWEWTSTYYRSNHVEGDSRAVSGHSCCVPDVHVAALGSAEPGSSVPRRVLKGGSHLCAPEYCLRYRPAARTPQAEDSATTHIGFRCAR